MVFGQEHDLLSPARTGGSRTHTGERKGSCRLDQEDSAEFMNAKATSNFHDRVQSEREGIGTMNFAVKPLDSDCQLKGAID